MPFRLKIFVGKFSLSFFLSLAILQFGLLSHVSSLRLSSGHSGLVLTLSMQPAPPCPAPACWWQTQVPGLLLPWDLWLGTYSVGYLLIFKNFSQLCCPLQFQIPHRPADERASCCLETSSFMTPSPGWVSVPNCLSLFLSFMFCTTSF